MEELKNIDSPTKAEFLGATDLEFCYWLKLEHRIIIELEDSNFEKLKDKYFEDYLETLESAENARRDKFQWQYGG